MFSAYGLLHFFYGHPVFQLASRLVLPSLWPFHKNMDHFGRGYSEKIPGESFETMLITNLRKLCFISNTLSTRVQTMDRCCANVWQKYRLSLLLGVSVAF